MSIIETTTLAPERLERIRGILKDRRVIRVDELSTELSVSTATVRRDLTELDRVGHVRKIHGGAVGLEGRLEEPLFDDKASIAAREKQAIAKYALSTIQPNDSVYLDGGSTVLALAHLLVSRSALTVVTNSLRVAGALSGAGPRVLLVGGELRRLSQTFVGPLTEPLIERLHFDKAFMGTMGLSSQDGMTTTDPAEAFTKKLVMKHAEHVFLLADSSKMDKVTFAHAGDVRQIGTLITDGSISPSLKRKFKNCGVNVVVARLTK
jgi:DeoR family fructose operon transcriptional repressor